MDLITDPTAAAADPGLPVLAGTRGFFTEGVAGLVAPTRVRAWFMNMVAKELLAVVNASGLAPDPTNSAQIIAALNAMYRCDLQVFTQSGIAPTPAGKTQALVFLWGGGGGGGGCNAPGTGGSGGGGGEFRLGLIGNLLPSEAITIGSPGIGGVGTGTGGAGGNSAFGSHMVSVGGGGGGGYSNGVVGGVGPGAYGGAGGQLNLSGYSGGLPLIFPGNPVIGGSGGPSFMSGSPTPNNGAGTGHVGITPGSGGNGGASNASGGAGGNGGNGGGGLAIILYI